MIISLFEDTKLYNYTIPTKVSGSYWLSDVDNTLNENRLVIVSAEQGKWFMFSNYKYELLSSNGIHVEKMELVPYKLFIIRKVNTSTIYTLIAKETSEKITKYIIEGNHTINIGRDSSSEILFDELFIEKKQAVLTYTNGKWHIVDDNSRFGLYVNDIKVKDTDLKYGDHICIMGLRIVVLNNLIALSNFNNKVIISPSLGCKRIDYHYDFTNTALINEIEIKESSVFSRSPRFKNAINEEVVKVDSPPAKNKEEETPLALVIGPSITMGMASMTTSMFMIINALSSSGGIKSAIPSMVMAVSMLLGCALWPLLTKKYEKKRKSDNEIKRKNKYQQYLKKKDEEIFVIMSKQSNTLYDTNPNNEQLLTSIVQKNRTLWEREIEQSDFLTIRLGIGNVPRKIKIDYSEEGFTLEDDELKKKLESMCNENTDLVNVPVTLSLKEKNILGIIGRMDIVTFFSESIILQLLSLHNYYDLKLVFFITDDLLNRWWFLNYQSHTWADDYSMRFISTNIDDTKIISSYLEQIYLSRQEDNKNLDKQTKYVIFTNWKNITNKANIFEMIFNNSDYLGFSVINICDYINDLPSRCNGIVNASTTSSELFTKGEYLETRVPFKIEYNKFKNLNEYLFKLANIKINFLGTQQSFPKSISFLDMYNVSKIEQLNILNRWQENNPTNSLSVPVGVDVNNNLFKLDVHEKYQGPHGLIAGMTGSGKSEFIITYILSLAINFSPEEVSFVLIDYKGGGLAGAFENKEAGYRLPHLAGTITNLDGSEIKRSLVSIESELKRRQKVFNEARDELGEGTIDIYKYQRYYREGKVKTPISHLFIISDEFAELKQQQPDFLDQLISTARIGRSLGVHLILATQKPAGVVNDQIWSNSRFRVCLKVQDKSDSNDMIKTGEAAAIKETGRFILQVGFNEYYAMGQSAWCGDTYIPSDKPVVKMNTSLEIVDEIGQVVIQIDNDKKNRLASSLGQQLTNIVKYISNVASEKKVSSRLLWLDKIPAEIYIDSLATKYQYTSTPYTLDPIIGEYDVPKMQTQKLLTAPISKHGNMIIYGSASSGKEDMLSTILYSMIKYHSSEEVGMYLIDFGTEKLRAFDSSPHVGGIAYVNDFEKIVNLFKLIKTNIEERKKLFIEFGGSYQSYIKYSKKGLPNIIVIINNYDNFIDTYPDFEQNVLQITREGISYGIYFILTVNSPSGVRYRVLQNFKILYSLQLNNEDDYYNVFGRIDGLYPSPFIGRGLLKIDDLYEFQTAKFTNTGNEYDAIKALCSKAKGPKTRPIPLLPENVNYEYIKPYYKGLSVFPVGAEKVSLNISCYNFIENYINTIYSSAISDQKNFVNAFVSMTEYLLNLKIIIFDEEKIVDQTKIVKATYLDGNYDASIKNIKEEIISRCQLLENSNYNAASLNSKSYILLIFVGLSGMLSFASEETKNNLLYILGNGKKNYKMNIVLFDSAAGMKKHEFEEWYRSNVVNNCGIWLGDDIANQGMIKLTRITTSDYKEIGHDFGYFVYRGKHTLIKTIKSETEYDSNE